MNKAMFTVPLLALAIGGSACATKGYVKDRVGEVNDKVETLGRSVEQTQEQTKQNASKINDVDQKTAAAQNAADQAGQAAQAADQHAQNAANQAETAANTANALDTASKRLVYEVVLDDTEGQFKLNKAELPDSAKAKLDDMVNQLKANPKDVWFEIAGYTDSTGSKAYNQQLGLQRAQAVERYLYEHYQIPLHKMNVISYGEADPVAPNKTRTGRAQNRRVVIRVLS